MLIDWKGDQVASFAHGGWNLMSYPICRDFGQKEGLLRRCILSSAHRNVNLSTGSDSRPEMVEIVSGNWHFEGFSESRRRWDR